eukprot:5004322-Pyramimonas_sp.AAC.1
MGGGHRGWQEAGPIIHQPTRPRAATPPQVIIVRQSLSPGTFPHDLGRLLLRYRTGRTAEDGGKNGEDV